MNVTYLLLLPDYKSTIFNSAYTHAQNNTHIYTHCQTSSSLHNLVYTYIHTLLNIYLICTQLHANHPTTKNMSVCRSNSHLGVLDPLQPANYNQARYISPSQLSYKTFTRIVHQAPKTKCFINDKLSATLQT